MALWLSLCAGYEAVASSPPIIQSVSVTGSERPLLLETKVGQPLEIARVSRDVRRLWATGWFDDIRVEEDTLPEGAAVRFRLTERPRYLLRRIRFEPRRFDLSTPIAPGTLVDRGSLERMANRFTEELKNSGYRDAVVHFELVLFGIRQADILFRVIAGSRYVIDRVEVSGASPEDSRSVGKILRTIRPQWLVPGIPGVWKGWKLRPQLDQRALELALQRLRSNYVSRGYLNATASVETTEFKESLASISIRVDPGTAYRLDSVQVLDGTTPSYADMLPSPFSLKDLCHCLLEKQADAELMGTPDFEVRLSVRPILSDEPPWTDQTVSLTAHTTFGLPFKVRTIEFQGNHRLGDSTLRQAFLLSEQDPFDRNLLRRSLTRLNLTGLIHPLTEFDVQVQRDATQQTVDLLIPIRERDSGRWFLSAPVWGGLSRGAALSIGSHLPVWGPASLELPTYFVAFNIASPFLGFSLFNQPQFSISLARSYLPTQSWRSGFEVSPQASWRRMVLAWAMHQVSPRLVERLQTTPSLTVPLEWNAALPGGPRHPNSGTLTCEPSGKLRGSLLHYVHTATNWLFPASF